MYVHKPYCIFIIALYLHLCLSLSMQCLYIESCFEGVIYICHCHVIVICPHIYLFVGQVIPLIKSLKGHMSDAILLCFQKVSESDSLSESVKL